MDALPVHALGALSIVVKVRDVDPRQVAGDDVTEAAHVPDISANAPITKTSTRPPLYFLSAVAIGPSEPGGGLGAHRSSPRA